MLWSCSTFLPAWIDWLIYEDIKLWTRLSDKEKMFSFLRERCFMSIWFFSFSFCFFCYESERVFERFPKDHASQKETRPYLYKIITSICHKIPIRAWFEDWPSFELRKWQLYLTTLYDNNQYMYQLYCLFRRPLDLTMDCKEPKAKLLIHQNLY